MAKRKLSVILAEIDKCRSEKQDFSKEVELWNEINADYASELGTAMESFASGPKENNPDSEKEWFSENFMFYQVLQRVKNVPAEVKNSSLIVQYFSNQLILDLENKYDIADRTEQMMQLTDEEALKKLRENMDSVTLTSEPEEGTLQKNAETKNMSLEDILASLLNSTEEIENTQSNQVSDTKKNESEHGLINDENPFDFGAPEQKDKAPETNEHINNPPVSANTGKKVDKGVEKLKALADKMKEFATELKNAKKFTNRDSTDYKELINLVEKYSSPEKTKTEKKQDVSPEITYKRRLELLSARIELYLEHKARDGVKRNTFWKLAAVEKLKGFIEDMSSAKEEYNCGYYDDAGKRVSKEEIIGGIRNGVHQAVWESKKPSLADSEAVQRCMGRIIEKAPEAKRADLIRTTVLFRQYPSAGSISANAYIAKREKEQDGSSMHM